MSYSSTGNTINISGGDVSSVNGKKGAVIIEAGDVGAVANGQNQSDVTVIGGLNKDVIIASLTSNPSTAPALILKPNKGILTALNVDFPQIIVFPNKTIQLSATGKSSQTNINLSETYVSLTSANSANVFAPNTNIGNTGNVVNVKGKTLNLGTDETVLNGLIKNGVVTVDDGDLNIDTADGGGKFTYNQEEVSVIRSGATSDRPANSVVGTQYFDTTLNKPIWWNGTVWVDATGAIVVNM